MLSKSLIQMIICRWKEFLREPSAAFFVILMPVLWMLILGFSFSSSPKEHYKVSFQGDQHPLAETFSLTLQQDSRIELIKEPAQAHVSVKLSQRGLTFIYDPTTPEGTIAKRLTSELLQKAAGQQDSIPTLDQPHSSKTHRYIDFLIPGLLALSLFTTSLFGTGMTIVVNRRENLLKRYLVTPMKPMEYIVSHIVGRYLIMAVELLTVLAAGFLLFDFRPAGSIIDLIILSSIGTACFASLGILCGSKTANSGTYTGMVNLIVLPMMLISGVWYSRDQFPEWLSTISHYLPLTALVDSLRNIALSGESILAQGWSISLLLAYLLVASFLSKSIFKWH